MILDLNGLHSPAFSVAMRGAWDIPDEALASPRFYIAFNRWMMRHWMAHLSGAEFSALLFVFDRTVGWSKRWERIPTRHFAEGFEHSNALASNEGTGYSALAIQRALAELCRRGALHKRGEARCAAQFSINFDWTPHGRSPSFTHHHNLESFTDMLKLPKSRGREGESGIKSMPDWHQKFTLKREKQKGSTKLSTKAAELPSPTAPSLTLVEQVKQATRGKRARFLASPHTAASLEMEWRSAWASAFPDIPAITWKQREGFAVKQWHTKWCKAEQSSASFAEMLRWIVSRWRLLMATEFRTFRAAPQFPVPGFAVKFSDRFEAAWHRRAELDKRTSMTAREEAEAAARDRGLSPEAAQREAEERVGISEQRDELERARRRLAAQQAAQPAIAPVLLSRRAVPGLKLTSKRVPLSSLMQTSPLPSYES